MLESVNNYFSVIRLVEGKTDKISIFSKTRNIPAVCVTIDTVNYVSIGNKNDELAAAAILQHGVENYFEMFNKFGQTGGPTFSRVTVSSSAIEIDTYTVSDSGDATLFDTFRVIKN